MESQLVGDCVSNGLSVGSGTGSAAEDSVVDRGELVCYPVCDVCPTKEKIVS